MKIEEKIIQSLREKGLLAEDKETLSIINETGNFSVNDLIKEIAEDYYQEMIENDPYRTICHASFTITLNANDTFAYACADATELSEWDLWWAAPIVEKYGIEGLFAVQAFIRKQEVIAPTEKYKLALAELKEQNPECNSRREWNDHMDLEDNE